MPERKTEFGKWCLEKGLTARTVAEETGIKLRTIYSYMDGTRYPCRSNLKKIEDTYNVEAREIFPL